MSDVLLDGRWENGVLKNPDRSLVRNIKSDDNSVIVDNSSVDEIQKQNIYYLIFQETDKGIMRMLIIIKKCLKVREFDIIMIIMS